VTQKFKLVAGHINQESSSASKCFCVHCPQWTPKTLPLLNRFLDRATGGVWSRSLAPGYRLLHSLRAGDDSAVTNLIALGADVNLTDQFGCSALHYARTPFAVAALLAAGSDPDACSRYRQTPLDAAIQAGDGDKFELLVRAGAGATHSSLRVVLDSCRDSEPSKRMRRVLRGNDVVVKWVNNAKISRSDFERLQTENYQLKSEAITGKRVGEQTNKRLQRELDALNQSASDAQFAFRSELTRKDEEILNLTASTAKYSALFQEHARELARVQDAYDKVSVELGKFKEAAEECSICMERPPDAALFCGHTFCKICIERMKPQKGVPNCPTCNKPSAVKRNLDGYLKLYRGIDV
jgi:hypothetical protein